MDHDELIEELTEIEKLTPAERIAIARQRRAFQLLKWREREIAAEVLLNSSIADGVAVRTLYERKPRVIFDSSVMLLEATARNDVDEVLRLLKNGADPNSHNEDGLTPLHQCAIDNNQEMLVVLLEHKADVNARDTELWTPLHAAACCGHAGIARQLIDKGASLLAVNADGNMPYDICDDEFTLDLIESEMAKRGITQEDIDEERLSIEKRMLRDLQALREGGGELDYRDEHGATPLHVASANGFYTCAQFLLEYGCSTDVQDEDGWQPVHAAACWAQADIIELLIAYGADINAPTPTSETALDLCEDETVRAIIMTLQVEAERQRLLSFGRDSRRMSKRRKPSSKFESPTLAIPSASENHLAAARGAIRRLSIRDRSGVTLARLEARREAALLHGLADDDNASVGSNVQASPSFNTTDDQADEQPKPTSVDCPSDCDRPMENGDDPERSEHSSLTVTVAQTKTKVNSENVHGVTDVADCDCEIKSVTDEQSEQVSSIRAISASAWLEKVRREEQEERASLNSTERMKMDGESRRTVPAPVSSGRNGQIGLPAPQYPRDIQPHARTLSPGELSFSRHAVTLSELKKQRAEERKATPIVGRSALIVNSDTRPNDTAMLSSGVGEQEGSRITYRVGSDADAHVSTPLTRSQSPKVGMRCCRIT